MSSMCTLSLKPSTLGTRAWSLWADSELGASALTYLDFHSYSYSRCRKAALLKALALGIAAPCLASDWCSLLPGRASVDVNSQRTSGQSGCNCPRAKLTSPLPPTVEIQQEGYFRLDATFGFSTTCKVQARDWCLSRQAICLSQERGVSVPDPTRYIKQAELQSRVLSLQMP